MSLKGFIGLGVMGFPMAGHLSKSHSMAVYNRTQSKAEEWLEVYKGKSVSSPEDLGRLCSEVYICVGADKDVREVISGERGILNTMASGSIIVDHTTTSSTLSKEMSELCLQKEIAYIDAPVSGGQAGAENGTLTIMVGGNEKAYETAVLTMSCYSKFSNLMGPSGSGQLTKMVNRWETMSSDQYDHGFAVDHMRKDLGIAIEEAKKNGLSLEVTELVDKFYQDIQDMGGNRWDTSSLLRRLKKND